MTYQEAIETWENGNISDFKKWLKKASKLNMLDAIEYAESIGIKRHHTINKMRLYSEAE